jgi:outer membrane protein OmpA-like peptidoglycan-associated protein
MRHLLVILCLFLATNAYASEIVQKPYTHFLGDTVKTVVVNDFVVCGNCILPPPLEKKPIIKNMAALIAIKEFAGDKKQPLPESTPNSTNAIISKQQNLLTVKMAETAETVRETVYFDFDTHKLKTQEREKIINFSENTDKNTPVKTIGYTCRIGTKEYNDALALKRAKEVSVILKSMGFKNVEVEAFGKCCYVSESENAKNRRVEILGNFKKEDFK